MIIDEQMTQRILNFSLPLYLVFGSLAWWLYSMPFDVTAEMQESSLSYWEAHDALRTKRLWMAAGLWILNLSTLFVAIFCLRRRRNRAVSFFLDFPAAIFYGYLVIITGLPLLTGGRFPGTI